MSHADFTAFQSAGKYMLRFPAPDAATTSRFNQMFTRTPTTWPCAPSTASAAALRSTWAANFPGTLIPSVIRTGSFTAHPEKRAERDNIGGWHDAGDYGRYVVNSGISTGALLWAWEINGKKLAKISLNIPESGNGTPDILSEIRWNLSWMLKMQDEDGGVWHKQTSEHFSGFVMPQDDKLPVRLSEPAPLPTRAPVQPRTLLP